VSQFDFLEGNSPARTVTRKRSGGRVVTIQKTSKRLKLAQLNAWALLFIGIIVMFIAAQVAGAQGQSPADAKLGPLGAIGSFCMLAGFVWIIVNRWQRWWHHG